MKYLLSIIIIFSVSLYALAEEDCISGLPNSEAFQSIESLQIPNCNQSKIIHLFNAGNISPLCESCLKELESVYPKLGIKKGNEDPLDLHKGFADEFKKSLAANLLDISKLRTLKAIDGNYAEAIKSCSVDSLENEMTQKGCKVDSDFKKIKASLGIELARLLSPKAILDNEGLYDRRSSSSSCLTPDYKIIQAMSATLESELTPQAIKLLSEIDPKENLTTSLISKFPNSSSFLILLKTHPVISNLMSRPNDFVDFFKKIPSPKGNKQLTDSLYSEKDTKLLENISNKCKSSFEAYKNVACSEGFKNNKMALSSVDSLKPLVGETSPSRKKYVNALEPDDVKNNENLLKICQVTPKKDAINLSPAIFSFQEGMPTEYATKPNDIVRTNKYRNEIGGFRDQICKDGANCDEKEIFCKVAKNISTEENLALSESSNSEVNNLLRSFIGTNKDIDESTKRILVAKGILPDSSGKIVEQPSRSERSRNFASNETSQPVQALQPTQQLPSQAPQSAFTAPTRSQSSSPASQSAQPQSSPTSDPTSFDSLSRSISDSRDQLAKINENILNRLSKPNAPQSVTRDDFRQMTREAYKEQNRTLPASEEEEFVNNYFPQQQSASPTQFANSKAAQFDKPTSAEQLRRNLSNKQRNEALAKFAGARDGQGSAASEEAQPQRGPASERAATATAADIAVNLPEGSTRLAEVLTSQLPDLKKMIEKGDDFTFKIRQTSNDSVFKIVKNGPNKFDVVFLSGDEKKAPLYKTELQSILDRLTVRASRDALKNALTTP